MSVPCDQADTITKLSTTINIELPEIKEDIKAIRKSLEGNGGVGLKTQTWRNKDSIGRLWWFIGPLCFAMILGSIKVWFL